MKALSLTQPWATLVDLEEKNFETRSWRSDYRGPLAIHAAKGFPQRARDICNEEPFKGVLAKHGYTASNLPLGVVLCVRPLLSCVRTEDLHKVRIAATEIAFGDYSEKRFAWQLGDVLKRFSPPVPARGHLSIWDWQTENVAFAPSSPAQGGLFVE